MFQKTGSVTMAAAMILIVVSSALLGCSGRSDINPAMPTVKSFPSENQHNFWGIYRVRIDLATGSTDVSLERNVAGHFNITGMLQNPGCVGCFTIKVTKFDLVNLEVTADVTLKNPTKALTGYDVRGIVYPLGNYILKNPDAYTLLYAPDGVIDPSGFRAYAKGNPNREVGPGEIVTETYVISFPEGSKFIDLKYAIDASYPGNCPEAYSIENFVIEPLGMNPGDSADASVEVRDWQADIQTVKIDASIFGNGSITLIKSGEFVYSGTITNVLGLPPGKYPCLISAKDPNTNVLLYQWVKVEVFDLSDKIPPEWDSEIGITSLWPGMGGILVEFGSASDPTEPVTYRLYWGEGNTITPETANKVDGISQSPYLLTGLNPGAHTMVVTALDGLGNETENWDMETTTVGVHPGVYWKREIPMVTARMFAGSFLKDNNFWVLGGYQSGTQLDSVERYNLATKQWDSPWSLPVPMDSFGCGRMGNNVYLFGGRIDETELLDTSKIIDISTGFEIPGAPALPQKLMSMGCAILDGRFYLAGGRYFTGSEWMDIKTAWSYAPGETEFSGETDMEVAISKMGFASGKGYLMQVGGYPGIDTVQYHVPGTKSWQFKSPLPYVTMDNVAVIIEGWLYSIGGEGGWMGLNNTTVMDIENGEWYEIHPMNFRRIGPTVSTDGNVIYVAGGGNNVGPAVIATNTVESGQVY